MTYFNINLTAINEFKTGRVYNDRRSNSAFYLSAVFAGTLIVIDSLFLILLLIYSIGYYWKYRLVKKVLQYEQEIKDIKELREGLKLKENESIKKEIKKEIKVKEK
mmetsp:Transcript_25869/g.22913  ORF Transcript_25869/g.22913 Transcript_25869/m.22913 type:complete len:106 (-) Transcript_25869:277-594(-)